MKILRANGMGKFISIKLCIFCKNQGIIIMYAILYVYKENKITKQGQKTIIIIKDVILIDSSLPNAFWAEVIEMANYISNGLPIKSRNYRKLIFKKALPNKRQNLNYIQIFVNLMLINILEEKRLKSD